MRRLALTALLLATLLATLTGITGTAHAATTSAPRVTSSTLGDRILNTAETRAGDWYSYGAAGPSSFDCSGLAVWAARQHGIWIPRTTYGLLAGSAHLYRIPLSWARRGDLIFFGSGHTEFDTAWYHTSFGAHHSGTRVGWRQWNGYYAPTMAMRFR